jgi:hypothetical protein
MKHPRRPCLAWSVCALAAGACACGGGQSAGPGAATVGSPSGQATVTVKIEQEVATGSTLTEFQKHRLLGHYSTYDGASGFILDRTVTPWKAKLDGAATVVTLRVSNHPRRDVTEYMSDDRSIWLRVDDDGTVEGFQGPKQHEGVEVVRDADANPLP